MPVAKDGKKICTKCNDTKRVTQFYKNRSTPDGYMWWCKDCSQSARRARKPHLAELDRLKEQGLRRCFKCKEIKSLNAFQKETRHSDISKVQCLDCRKEYIKDWLDDNPDKTKLYQRRMDLKRNYGITVKEYDEMLTVQKGLCAICKCTTDENVHENFAVDHDHKTGDVRGLLCNSCNFMLGLARDDVLILRSAIEYLEQP